MDDPAAPSPDADKTPGSLPPDGSEPAHDLTREYDTDMEAEVADELLLSRMALVGTDVVVPTRLGKYDIQGLVGRGGMGIVWKGYDPDLRRTVAIKVLNPQLAQSQVARRRFQREARAAAAISHENVLTIHSVEEQGQTPFLVMEYVSGQSLREYLARHGKLAAIEVIRLSAQIAQGLAAAHAQGVIHRDVKLANVMLHAGATRVRLMDFGLARVSCDNADLTSHDHAVGTPAYMAPEQVRGNDVDARADLFSLGCVMYCLFTGQSPFHGKTHAETVLKIVDLVPARLHEVDPAIPVVLSEIVEKLLMKDPDERYQSAFEVAEILSRLQAQINQTPTPQLANVLNERLPVKVAPDAVTELVSQGPARRSYGALLPVAALFIVIGGLTTWKVWPPGEDSQGSGESRSTVGAGQGQGGEQSPAPKLTRIVVGSGPEATCATLGEALSRAAPNCTVIVVGPGPFVESIAISGSAFHGLTLQASPRATWQVPVREGSESHALQIRDVADVSVEGFDFEVATELGRAVQVLGTVGNVTITDCGFRQTLPAHKVSLVNVTAAREQPDSRVVIQNCRFTGAAGTGYCVAVDSKEETGPNVACQDCYFESVGKHLYVAKSCRQFQLSGTILVGGENGLLLSFKPWAGDEEYSIVNNTFVGTKYWFSWMDSTPSPAPREGTSQSRLCNNLILGGERTQGNTQQWNAMLAWWTCRSNWWERDATTTATADRGGKLATIHDKLSVPVRTNPTDPQFLVPAADSPLLTQGAGGDLPSYIGSKGPKP